MSDKELGVKQFMSHATALYRKKLIDTEVIKESLKILLRSMEGESKSPIKLKSSPKKSLETNGTSTKKTTVQDFKKPLKRSLKNNDTTPSNLSSQSKRPRRSVSQQQDVKKDNNLVRKRGGRS